MDIWHNCALGIRKQFKLWEILENFMKSMQTENINEPRRNKSLENAT